MAEPVHSTGYLPMYIAMAKDYFAESGITVKIVTIETGSGHTNAVLSEITTIGSTLGRVSSTINPRIVRIGAKMDF